jgi:hypothetical protein
MQVGHLVAEARQVDLLGPEHLDQRLLQGEYHPHYLVPAVGVQIGHLFDMTIPDNAAQPWVIGLIGPDGGNVVFPQDLAAGFFTKCIPSSDAPELSAGPAQFLLVALVSVLTIRPRGQVLRL